MTVAWFRVLGRGNVTDALPIQIKRAARLHFNLKDSFKLAQRYLHKSLNKTEHRFLLTAMTFFITGNLIWLIGYVKGFS